MSLSSIMNSASSGLSTAQTQITVVSDNISNVNTPGYAQKVVNQQSIALSAVGGGVSVGQITLTVDTFLQQASLNASAQAGGSGTLSDMLDRAQSMFGDPTTASGYFNQLDEAFSAFSSAAQDPASTVSRNQALTAISNFLDQSSQISSQLTSLSQEVDSRLSGTVGQVNDLLRQIADLNTSLVQQTVAGGDTTGAQNAQSQLINTLSSMVDVTVSRRDDGGLDVRGAGGALLISRAGPATMSFSTTGATPGQLLVAAPSGTARPVQPNAGVLKGLIDTRNVEIPAISAQLGEYVSQAVDQINKAHNASSAVPPPTTLTGRNTGLDLPTAVSGFTGKTTIDVVDSTGVVQSKVDIDFDALTMNLNGTGPVAFDPNSFQSTLNGLLGASASVSFNNGALSIQATGSNGVAIGDDATTPSSKAGRGFSQFFGLNDLITTTGFPNPATGLSGSDPNGFNAGGVMTLRILDSSGMAMRDAQVAMPAGGTVDDLITALNSTTSGVGLYGAYSLDGNGQLTFSPNQPGVHVGVLSDTSQRGVNGPTASALFGLNPSLMSQRATSFSVRSDIATNSLKLSMAQLDLTAGVGQSALSPGDDRGAQLLAAAGDTATNFNPAGPFGALSATLAQYGAQFSGTIAQRASAADANKANAQAVSSAADSRRASVEGVNLDEELIKLTTYQQSYNAAARLIQAVSDLYNTLLQIQ